jgi:uncharacterized protein YjgD (DUF1641 family)
MKNTQILEHFLRSSQDAEIIDEAIKNDAQASSLLENLISSNIKITTAMQRAINNNPIAVKEITRVMSNPKVATIIRCALDEDKEASRAIRNAINLDGYCRQLIFEEITNASEEVQLAINAAVEKSASAIELMKKF